MPMRSTYRDPYGYYPSVPGIKQAAYLLKKAMSTASMASKKASKQAVKSPMYKPTYRARKSRSAKNKMAKKSPNSSLIKSVRTLQKHVNSNLSKLTYRFNDVFRLIASANQTAMVAHVMNDVSVIELCLAQLRFFDPSNPGTLINGSGATGTYSRQFDVKASYTYKFKNNYQVPVELRVYKYRVKSDTNITPYVAFTNGLADVGNPTSTSPVVYPSDSPQLHDLWSPSGVTTWKLLPGQEKTFNLVSREFKYDPADVDSHNLSYQKKYDAQAIMLRIVGPPAHDKTTATQLGFIGAGIDYSEKATYVIKYNSGGPAIEYIYVSDAADAMTAGAMVSQPVCDNQEFSTN